jgi:diguanylate cyclase (GGDEF)-like protein
MVKEIIQELHTPFEIHSNEVSISTSVGIAFYPDYGEDLETLIRNADMAMYTAKQHGKNTYHIYDDM